MELPETFAVLREALSQMQREGGQPVAAAVKNRMLRLTDRTFSERAVGHASFRAFLQAAEAAGVVALAPTAGGDVEVLLPGQPQHAATRRIRRDFWNAFIKWDDGRTRLYDRDTDRVLNLDPAAAGALTGASEHRYVPIPAPARAATAELMRKFVEQVPTEARAGLETILAGTDDVEKAFVDALPLEARAAWRSVTAWQVLSRAEAWRKENDVDVDLYRDPAAPPARPATSPSAAASRTDRAGGNDDAIRRRVVQAVQRMPMSALLQLSIPVEYLLADEAP